ncbi:MAG: hypothetical protein JO189_01470 [Deltaproteobacteria bacterium]|nr:hypothetical protein [Deltaproteobacteria bacterium]
MLNKLLSYFALERPVFGGAGIKRELVLYSGVVIGTVGHWLFQWSTSSRGGIGTLAAGIVASVVIFPTIYYAAGLDKIPANFVKWCVAFQNGFFWQTIIEQVQAAAK